MTIRLDISRPRNSTESTAGPRSREVARPGAAGRVGRRRARSVQTAAEPWRSHCLGCARVWEELYEARYCGNSVTWRLSGLPAQPPWADRSCPACGSLRVKVLPASLTVVQQSARK